MPVAPSGRQTLLAHGTQRAVVVEVGGGLRTYAAGGIEVLDGYDEGDRCSAGRGQPLLPWPNRLDGGRYEFGGVQEVAPLTEPERGNAIHGLTRWAPWQLLAAQSDVATLGFTLQPQPGWAWTLELTVSYRLSASGLRVTTTAVNRSETACPFGAGFHPYLLAPSGRVDDLVLTVPAASYCVTNDRSIPTGSAPVDGTPWDFRTPRAVGDLQMDIALGGLTRDTAGTAVVTVADAVSDWRVDMHFETGWDYAMVYSGDKLGARSRHGLAIEPMTGPANLFNSGDGLIVLEPARPWAASWSIAPAWL